MARSAADTATQPRTSPRPPGVIRADRPRVYRAASAKQRQAILGRLVVRVTVYVLLVMAAVLVLFPIAWMVLTSFKSVSEANTYPPTFLPHQATLSSYRQVFKLYPILQFLLNSLIIATCVTLGTLVSCSMGAFALVHFRFRLKGAVFFLVIGTLLIPFAATMVPLFIEMSKLHWINTWYPLIVPAFFANGYGIFLLRQMFRSVPRSLAESATIDGCGPVRILWRIYVPLSTAALAALGVVTFINSWNNLIAPLIFVNQTSLMPVSVGLAYLQGQGAEIWAWLMAGSTISILPLVIIYAVGQRYVVAGMTLTGANR